MFTSLLALLPDARPRSSACASDIRPSASRAAGVVDRETPVHGKASLVFHEGKGIFEGVTDPFEAGRYHSLVVLRKTLPDELELTAWTEDGLVMATQHRTLPRYGVQFHPESILTPEGPRIVENFLALVPLREPGSSDRRRTRRSRARHGIRPRSPRRTRPPGST